MKKHYFFLVLILLQACNADKSKKVDLKEISFETQESSELFFKNIRQSAYFTEEKAEAGLLLFRHREWSPSAPFTPVIVFNWRNDKAYMLIEWREPEVKQPFRVTARVAGKEQEQILYEEGNMMEQLRFLSSIYNAIVEGATLTQNGEKGDALFTNNDRETFRIIMFDYFRLTGLY